ncbi:MAG: carboxymuconolactone decarboxylase family protein [Nevskiales bacterium]
MTSPLLNVEWESCLLQPTHDPVLEAYARRHTGLPHPTIRYFARAPWVARTMVQWLPEHGLLVELDLHLSDLIGLVVSQENSCRFCYAAVRALLRIQGMSEERIQRLEQQLARVDVEPKLAAVVRFARRLSHSNPPIGEADVRALRDAGFGAAAVREIAFAVVASVMMNRTSTIAAVPPQAMEGTPELLYVRWLRPLIARWLDLYRKPGHAVSLPAAPAGPFKQVVQAFDGSPIAPLLARTLDEMWAAPALTQRCRALLFAVVARGLGASQSEAEARALLAGCGMEMEHVSYALAHLDAAELDAVERELLPFARETIWYEPVQLQRRARQLGERLNAEQLTDAIGVVSLANALCRLQMTVSATKD